METKIYKILPFEFVVAIFESRKLHFNKPESWDAPYEKAIKHGMVDSIFAQCWSTKGMSDAMWRIYSKNHLGIRIRTTKQKLTQALEQNKKAKNFDYRIGKVKYLSNEKLDAKHIELRDSIRENPNSTTYTDHLYFKRYPFSHESELRATILTSNNFNKQDHIKIDITPHELIDKIVIDPRAPKEISEALIFYFKKKLKFRGSCRKSILYREPSNYELD